MELKVQCERCGDVHPLTEMKQMNMMMADGASDADFSKYPEEDYVVCSGCERAIIKFIKDGVVRAQAKA